LDIDLDNVKSSPTTTTTRTSSGKRTSNDRINDGKENNVKRVKIKEK